MSLTPASLLERLRTSPDAASWKRLVDLYDPLLRAWLRRLEVAASDLDDLVQEALTVVTGEVARFEHNGHVGAFRKWLRAILVNCVRRYRRAKPPLAANGDGRLARWLELLEDPASEQSLQWEREHNTHVGKRLLELLEPEFEPATWQAFRLLVLEQRPTAEVATQLHLTPNAVRIAKSRVLGRLREEARGLLDE